MLQIRNATVADIGLIRELTFNIWPQTYMPILGEAQVTYMLDTMYTPAVLEKQMQDGQQYLLCYDDDRPVAFASYSPLAQHVYKLNKIYVLPLMQGKGIGAFIIDHIKTCLREKNALVLELNVNRYNSAKNFYEKLGFTVHREEDIDIGNGYFMNDYVLWVNIE